ncbi:Phosphatidylinositol-3,4,5-trisphosphate 5-phosphatase 2 [Chelonia mydas]|uniref:Phosphatidylinositol-3,4,5-trisphosphate 5-phosphatase 2 n=1 Tax=Chelonia mydas TaxID=8469 RepID=M7ARM7_CHEMY|nr:Phosphatidylinositol-3,4,5-trisphosphate 5-phosphatase 2 [Chelonia mydas]
MHEGRSGAAKRECSRVVIARGAQAPDLRATNGLSTVSHEYLKGSYTLDLEAVKAGASSLPHLNKTLVTSCKRLHSEVDKVLSGLEILSKVFDQQSSPVVSRILQQTAGQTGEQELESLVLKLSVLKDFLSSIEKKALKALQDMSSTAQSALAQPSSRKAKSIPVQAFEVKLDITLGDLTKIGKSQKFTLSVDVEGGKLVVLKKQKDSQEDWNTFTHDKIRQLIKSQRVQNKLGIVFEKEKDKTQRKDFVFVSARKREAFCQLLQLMKNKHSKQDEPDMISVFIGTWNMGSVPPPKSITSWFTSKGLGKTLDEMTVTIPHDIYVFGTQENSMGDKEWVDFLRGMLKEFTEIEYRPIAMQALWNIKIAVLVRPEHENRISHVSTSSVKTGIANTLGNKGAVGVSFMFNGTSFGFVNCHLTSGNEKTARLMGGGRVLPGNASPQRPVPPAQVRTNVPSWCDRILWKSYPETHINCNSYGCTDDITTSDHSPVFGAFEVGVTSQFVSKKGLSKASDQAYIEFENIEAIVKTASRTKFFIEFYSTCLEEFKKSFENDMQSSDNINFLKVQWSSRQLPTLKPILSEIEYLQDQHLLLTVKSVDGYESYGECVIALKSMIGSTAQQFLTYLSHRGEETGNIRGSMKVRVPAERMGTRERLYEWISIDKDETGAAKGKLPPVSRASQEHAKSAGRKPLPGETAACPLGKLFDEPEKPSALTAGRLPGPLRGTSREETSQARSKQDSASEPDGGPMKNSFNNPAYYVLEGVPHQLLAADPPTPSKGPAPKNKVQITVPVQPEWRRQPLPGRGEESSSDEDTGTLNLPPPDFPPPPLPKAVEFEVAENPLYASAKDLGGAAGREEPSTAKPWAAVAFSDPLESKLAPPKLHPRPPPSPGPGFLMEPPNAPQAQGGLLDDRSCSVLQMAKTLSEVDYPGSKGGSGLGREQQGRPAPHLLSKGRLDLPPRCMHPDYSRPITFPPRSIRESIEEDLAEEALGQGGRSSSSLSECSVGEWLLALGLERYEEGLIHNGWDDLEFLSDITDEDLEEAGVLDPNHKRLLLENLQKLRK